MTKLEVALAYASWGWHVLPVVQNGKVPATRHGVHDSTTDASKIKQWWTENPDYNIGVATGEKSGIVVFDIDPRNGGDTSWEQFQAEHGAVPNTVQALTAGGGEHYIARLTHTLRSCKVRDGIDFLADGRYFLAYPSTIEDRRYEWEASSDPFDGIAPMTVPDAWIMAMSQQKKTASSTGDLIQGNRNDGLTSLAGAMRSYGMTEAEILAALSVANERRCEIPLPASEIQQIARSVARYEPDSDVAANAAIGSAAAEAFLSSIKEETSYFLTRGSSFLGQPSPLPWLIKGWLPAYSTAMVFGESGIGKTFFALDMACSIACGIPWQGIKTDEGVVVYLAGEGNYGMRQRIASWCIEHGMEKLDNLLISNKPIDLDSPSAASEVLSAIYEMTKEPVKLVVIDTLNNHMSGDENSARDTRTMLNSCNVISSAIGASTMLLHHMAHSADAKFRARGSSAWRGALDASIMLSYESDQVIKVACTKMKDAPEPSDLFGELAEVDLGWVDDEGQKINGAVFKLRHYEPKKKESGYEKHRKIFENAWFDSGAELINGQPYISRSAFSDYLVRALQYKESTIDKHFKPSTKGGLINDLITGEYIKPSEHGWIVVSQIDVSALKMRRSG
jgi:hypothetical protein